MMVLLSSFYGVFQVVAAASPQSHKDGGKSLSLVPVSINRCGTDFDAKGFQRMIGLTANIVGVG